MEIVEYSKTQAVLGDLRQRYEGVVYPVTTAKGMIDARKGRAEIREWRTGLEKERVRIKAPALERARLIDSEAKRITAELSKLEERKVDGKFRYHFAKVLNRCIDIRKRVGA